MFGTRPNVRPAAGIVQRRDALDRNGRRRPGGGEQGRWHVDRCHRAAVSPVLIANASTAARLSIWAPALSIPVVVSEAMADNASARSTRPHWSALKPTVSPLALAPMRSFTVRTPPASDRHAGLAERGRLADNELVAERFDRAEADRICHLGLKSGRQVGADHLCELVAGGSNAEDKSIR